MSAAESPSREEPRLVGSWFLRADLHVHTHQDSDIDSRPDLRAYVAAATAAGIDVLAITDHNHARFVRDAMAAASGTSLTVIPGIEVSTHDGHLLALFGPDNVDELDAFAHAGNLHLKQLSATEFRSTRSMLDLVEEIHRRHGLAIPAHVDASNGMAERLRAAELTELLTNPALAALEFATTDAIRTWFTDEDEDVHRRAAWKARQAVDELRERGLGRLMSSDAHTPEKVGEDRRSRTLTRLRLDDVNFDAIRNAIVFNPNARCKAEAILPATYPHVVSATFEGGFLDGVTMSFSQNLNCLIGGRGSGKSTALLAVRAALGAPVAGEDADAAGRMPDKTTVQFVDSAGSLRTAVRVRQGAPVDASGAPIRLRIADLGQDESGRLARGYADDPQPLLEFLDGFVVRHQYDETEEELLAQLADNGAEVSRTAVRQKQIDDLTAERERLDASLKAAQESRVEDIAKWAVLLASQGPLLDDLGSRLTANSGAQLQLESIDLDGLAQSYGVDLRRAHVAKFVDGTDGLRHRLGVFQQDAEAIAAEARASLSRAAESVRASLEAWNADHEDLQARLSKRRAELEAQGLKVQADAVSAYAARLEAVKSQLTALQKQQALHQEALRERARLLALLADNREKLYLARTATIQRISAQANRYSDDLTIRVFYERGLLDGEWVDWLTKLGFNRPRVQRLARAIRPAEFATAWLSDPSTLLRLVDPANGQPFFTEPPARPRTWQEIFTLQTMRCEDRPRIEVQQRGEPDRHPFHLLSEGQQRSVLLSLLLCAERCQQEPKSEPLSGVESGAGGWVRAGVAGEASTGGHERACVRARGRGLSEPALRSRSR